MLDDIEAVSEARYNYKDYTEGLRLIEEDKKKIAAEATGEGGQN